MRRRGDEWTHPRRFLYPRYDTTLTVEPPTKAAYSLLRGGAAVVVTAATIGLLVPIPASRCSPPAVERPPPPNLPPIRGGRIAGNVMLLPGLDKGC